jgi:dihydrofolate reductase
MTPFAHVTVLAAEAVAALAPRDGGVYVDGGDVIRQFLDAGLINEATITVIPIDIGEGVPLFTDDAQRARLGEPTFTTFPSGVQQLRFTPAS